MLQAMRTKRSSFAFLIGQTDFSPDKKLKQAIDNRVVSLIGCAIILAVRPMILDFYRDKLTETAIYYLGIFIIMTTWRLVRCLTSW